MNKSESIIKIAAALAKAQAEMPAVKMNAVNPFLKNKYADLGAVIETSRPILAKHGLAIAQTVIGDGVQIGVTTMLMHESGEWLQDTITLSLGEEKGKSSAQVAGSIISYLRRYSWASILGLYADEDTDGNHAQPKPASKPEPTEAERKQKGRDKYAELYKRGQYVGLAIPALDGGATLDQMTAQYKEQKAIIEAAEALAEKAGY
jgi:hypothetical protein